ncbi:MAG: hypothetical protein M3Y62_03710 [Candidatus Dormibacteraeota bacterium]|nr:hypothetical protein [Candidatus Dormibacteraeota bacterium]
MGGKRHHGRRFFRIMPRVVQADRTLVLADLVPMAPPSGLGWIRDRHCHQRAARVLWLAAYL